MRLDWLRFLVAGLATLSMAQQADAPYPALIPRSPEAREAARRASEIAERVADGHAYYVISFDSSPSNKVDDYHTLEIQVDKPGVTVRANTGYYAQP